MNEIDRAIDYICELEKQESKKAGFTYGGTKSMREAEENQTRLQIALTALREKAERERGCAYCVIGKRSPDAEYCSNCGRKLTPTLPELANESEEVNRDSRQYLDNDSTYRRKSVKQMGRNLYSETAETCTVTQEQPINFCKVRRGNDDHA